MLPSLFEWETSILECESTSAAKNWGAKGEFHGGDFPYGNGCIDEFVSYKIEKFGVIWQV